MIRNADEHGETSTARNEQKTKVLQAVLREYGHRRMELFPADRDLIPANIEGFISRTGPKALSHWMITTGPLLQQAFRRVKGKSITGTRSIKAYFGYGTSQTEKRMKRAEDTEKKQEDDDEALGERAGSPPRAVHATYPP